MGHNSALAYPEVGFKLVGIELLNTVITACCVFLFISTNLVFSLFSVFVFKPNEPRPLFSQKAVCSGQVSRAVFAPREQMLESCEESSQWLNRSQLYFLTQNLVNTVVFGVL